MNLLSALVLSVLWVFEATAFPLGYYSGKALTSENIGSITARVSPGTVILIGEKHYNPSARQGQLELLQTLRQQGFVVSVGMEFISYLAQAPLDQYHSGALGEEEFLKQVNWGPNSFDLYRDQVLFPLIAEGGQVRAINASRQVTGKIAKLGLQSLTAEELSTLPPGFQVGRASYKKRFEEVTHHLPNPQAVDNYFTAQSVWDDTMAWQSADFLSKNPNQVFVIIVGEFHVQYGGGLPDRLRARGIQSVLTLSQVDHSDYSVEELEKEIIPHPEFGPRADFLWIF